MAARGFVYLILFISGNLDFILYNVLLQSFLFRINFQLPKVILHLNLPFTFGERKTNAFTSKH